MNEENKNSFKVLTTNDIRTHARDWTLAGDVKLLAHLEQFSEKIFTKTQETQKCFDELIESYEKTYTNVGNVTNEFLALQNCQFVENRVYDEETPTEEKPEVKVLDEAEQEKLLLIQYKEAVEVGVRLLDTHFQEVQLPANSDSDEEDEISGGNSVIWKPKNPYAGKKFPLLIGSNEWRADDNVGLRDAEENLDTDKMMSEYESDVESIHEMEKTIHSSSLSSIDNEKSVPRKPVFLESSSEDLFGLNKSEDNESKISDFFENGHSPLVKKSQKYSPSLTKNEETKIKNTRNSFSESEVSEDMENIPEDDVPDKKLPKQVNMAFAKELASKIASANKKGDYNDVKKIEENSPEDKPKEKKPIHNDGLFDETDEGSDLFSETIKGIAVGSKGLFFDSENDDRLFTGSNNLLFEPGNAFESESPKKSAFRPVNKVNKDSPDDKSFSGIITPGKSLHNDLFENADDENTLFSPKPAENKHKNESLIPNKDFNIKKSPTVVPKDLPVEDGEGLFDSINNDFEEDILNSAQFLDKSSNVKKSIDSRKKNVQSSADKEEHRDVLKKNTNSSPASIPESHSKEESSNSTPSFSMAKQFPKKISFFDSDEDDDDLFSSSFKENSLLKEDKKGGSSIFKTFASAADDDSSLFEDKPKQQDSLSISSSRSSLFDDVSATKSKLASVFEKDKNNKPFNVSDNSLFADDTTAKDDESSLFNSKIKEKSSLFESDDLFGITKSLEKSPSQTNKKAESLFDEEKPEKKMEKSDSLFPEEQSTVPKSSILDDLEDDEDLFKSSPTDWKETEQEQPKNKTPEGKKEGEKGKVRETKSELFGEIVSTPKSKISSSEFDDDSLFKQESKSSTDISKPKPPTSLSLKKDGETTAGSSVTKTKSVGKLNIPDNLKIKFESAAKKISPGGVKQKEDNENEIVDDPFKQPSSLLKCPSKDRVKIPVRRRPQSRRARQEALRTSGIDFGVEENSTPKLPENTSEKAREYVSPVNSNPLSPSTDEEDYFNVPELDTNFEKEDQSIFKSELFNSSDKSKVDDNLLFDGAPVLSPVSPKKDTGNRVEDKKEDLVFVSLENNEDVDVFGVESEKISNKDINNRDDGDDGDDDDDDSLFASISSKTNVEKVSVFDGGSVVSPKNMEEEEECDKSSGLTKSKTEVEKVSVFDGVSVKKNINSVKQHNNDDDDEVSLFTGSKNVERVSVFGGSSIISPPKGSKADSKDKVVHVDDDDDDDSLFTGSKNVERVSVFGGGSMKGTTDSKDVVDDDDDSLFNPIQKLKGNSLFGGSSLISSKKNGSEETDDDDSLFSSKTEKVTNVPSKYSPKTNVITFKESDNDDDDDDDDSLFTSTGKKSKVDVFGGASAKRTSGLWVEEEEEEDFLFSSQTKSSKMAEKVSIFDDDDDDDDNLFKSSTSMKSKDGVGGLNLFKDLDEGHTPIKKFDASFEDEDDLFGKNTTFNPKVNETPKNTKNTEKNPQVQDKENKFVDPLGLMGGDE